MAKTKNRMELREQAEAAEKLVAEGKAPAKKKEKKAKEPKEKAAKKPAAKRKSTKKKAVVQRLRMMWGVFDNSNQQVAIFPYTDRDAAAKKVSDYLEKGKVGYFVQPVKQPIVEVEVAAEAK